MLGFLALLAVGPLACSPPGSGIGVSVADARRPVVSLTRSRSRSGAGAHRPGRPAVPPRGAAGRPVLVFFGYTHCPDVCPTTVGVVNEVLDAVGEGPRAVFISIDPERDDVAAMAVSHVSAEGVRRLVRHTGRGPPKR